MKSIRRKLINGRDQLKGAEETLMRSGRTVLGQQWAESSTYSWMATARRTPGLGLERNTQFLMYSESAVNHMFRVARAWNEV